MEWLCVASIFANAGLLGVILYLHTDREEYKGGVKRLEREVECFNYCGRRGTEIIEAARIQEERKNDL